MFVVERILGVSVYLVLLLSACYLIFRSKNSHVKTLIVLYLIGLTLMAFFYVPAVEADLHILTQYMFDYAEMPYAEFTSALAESNAPLTLVYYRIIGSFGVVGLLAAVTVFIVYSNIFYIVYNYSKKIASSSKAIAFTLLMLMSTGLYMQTASGIRNMLAFSILARCFYDEMCNDKKIYKNILWYIVACLIHPAAITLVLLRIVALIWTKFSERKTRSLLAILVTLPIFTYLIFLFGAGGYIDNVAEKATDYVNQVSYTYLWDNLITLIILLLIFISYRIYLHNNTSPKSGDLRNLLKLSYVLSLFSLLFIFEHTTFVRFTLLNLIIMIPVILENASMLMKKQKSRTMIVLQKSLIYLVILMLVISMTRGSLSSLKFFAGA